MVRTQEVAINRFSPRGSVRALPFAVVTLLAGCANDSRQGLETRLAPLVGQSEVDLLRRLGPPASTTEVAGGRSLVYLDSWPVVGGPNFVVPHGTPMARICELTFSAVGGKVTGYALRGEACGWGGRPAILPG